MRRIPFVMTLMILVAATAGAQPGNLVASGQFDDSADVGDWFVLSPGYSGASHSTTDADSCAGSGSFLATADPPNDFSTATYWVCLGAIQPATDYSISGDFHFASQTYAARANLTLNFKDGPDCTGDFTNGLFAGYAESAVTGWQHVAAGPVTPGAGTQSAMISILLTQYVGDEPEIFVRADNVRVVASGWIFGEGVELGSTCRWSATVP